MGLAKGVPPIGFPEGRSPRRVGKTWPPNRVLDGGLPRGFPLGWFAKQNLQMWSPGGYLKMSHIGFPKACPKSALKGVPQLWPPWGCRRMVANAESPKGGPTKLTQDGCPQCGGKQGHPVSVPRWRPDRRAPGCSPSVSTPGVPTEGAEIWAPQCFNKWCPPRCVTQWAFSKRGSHQGMPKLLCPKGFRRWRMPEGRSTEVGPLT
jgi:hypothetical protein